MTYLVVGAGFTGATVAERIATVLGEEVLVVERRAFVGGSAADYHADDGLIIQRFGPHIFHTNSDRVWQYVQGFATWRPIQYKVAARVFGVDLPLPLGFEAIRRMTERMQVGRGDAESLIAALGARYGLGARIGIPELRRDFPPLAEFVIEHVFRSYNEKHWGMPLLEVPASVIARLPIVIGDQESYFTDKYQAVPVDGYTETISRMLDHPKIKIRLGHGIEVTPECWRGDHIIWTGSPDAFFGEAGALPYRSVEFDVFRGGPELTRLNLASPYATFTYPDPRPYTRSSEMLHINGGADPGAFSGGSALVSDYPRAYVPGENDPFYPIPLEKNIRLAQDYARRAPKSVWFAGRLGSYTYLNMDQAIAQGLSLFEQLRKGR